MKSLGASAMLWLLESFPPGPWRVVGMATIGLALVALLALGLLKLINRTRLVTSSTMPDLDARSLLRVLEEVKGRIRPLCSEEGCDAVHVLEELIRGAMALEASDIHLSPLPRGLCVTYRVHGSLHQVDTLPEFVAPLVINRIKVLSRLDLHVRHKPQDGRLVTRIGSQVVEARVSTLPTESGERVALRLVRGGRAIPTLESLGFSDTVHQHLLGLLSRPQGLVFVTGPVGSGKTTTLYAALEHISNTRGQTTSMVTLEDPIELELPFATQTQIQARAGMNFASALRSILRQDPNVLMLGEIRDSETADIAMQAGLTGHLILTTVHADNSAGPFARMIDMKIEPFLLASSTVGCLSQRLVRTLCPACRRRSAPEPIHHQGFRRHQIELGEEEFWEPVGCPACENQGYTGRIPIAELLLVDAKLREAIHASEPTEKIRSLAIQCGMVRLIEDGLRRARLGETSLTEVLRVVG